MQRARRRLAWRKHTVALPSCSEASLDSVSWPSDSVSLYAPESLACCAALRAMQAKLIRLYDDDLSERLRLPGCVTEQQVSNAVHAPCTNRGTGGPSTRRKISRMPHLMLAPTTQMATLELINVLCGPPGLHVPARRVVAPTTQLTHSSATAAASSLASAVARAASRMASCTPADILQGLLHCEPSD